MSGLEKFTVPSLDHLQEIQLYIYDEDKISYGGNQYWFPKKFHQLSGCGPIAAANITAYLAINFDDKYMPLYPYKGNINKKEFLLHMIEVRKYVVPGWRGLTSVHKFADNTLAYASEKGISLVPHILEDDTVNIMEAVQFISQALEQRLPVAILVLTHPIKELKEYVWHWMTITHLKLNPADNKFYITTSSYGERREVNFDLLWNNRRKKDHIKLAYFT
ncbi:hypothetical protein [Clostridium thermarum]|uniref:hypothetical protein n=1 Tax=Clostridium thermarum TaxID=1716543 RepID=UPI0013D063A5|nr:hypothetical protein [Clostridium thermarum]